MKAGLVRVYFNGAGEDSRVWSVDLGAGSDAWKVRRVEWHECIGATCAGLHRDRSPERTDEPRPRVWLEFRRVVLRIVADEAALFHDDGRRLPAVRQGRTEASGG